MHLNNVLFLCTTLYFFQCMAAPPTDEQLNMIKRLIAAKLGQDGKMEFSQLKEVLIRVGIKVRDHMRIPSQKDIEIKSTYANDEVEIGILSYVSRTKPEINELVKAKVVAHMGQNEVMDFDTLKAVCKEVAEETGISKEFLSIDLFQKIDSNRIFTKLTAEIHVLAYAATNDPGVHAIVKNEVEKFENPNNKTYADFKKIFTIVKRRTLADTIFRNFEEFKRTYKKSKVDPEDAEQVICNTFFKQ
ncbi:uncharacterized protein LOC126840015 [Adelges cooleyi]|uniref:uncharacterized protein LOC126840015 n=1 Tax=Adelges cooleyi TaxID=133065 RepID=UPI0021807B1F|nr:uncharacterized protein LOC126840015 [Adelges cooleyi]